MEVDVRIQLMLHCTVQWKLVNHNELLNYNVEETGSGTHKYSLSISSE